MKLYETHIQFMPGDNKFAIRSERIDGTGTVYFYRDIEWLKVNCENDIPYDWDVVKRNPDKWFLL